MGPEPDFRLRSKQERFGILLPGELLRPPLTHLIDIIDLPSRSMLAVASRPFTLSNRHARSRSPRLAGGEHLSQLGFPKVEAATQPSDRQLPTIDEVIDCARCEAGELSGGLSTGDQIGR